jgi:ribosomal-protein-alanine N-acetyltransferase
MHRPVPRLAPILSLPGLRLRPLHEADRDDLLAALGHPEVTARTSYPVVTPALVEAMIARSVARWGAGEPGRWALVRAEDDRLIGTCGFTEAQPAHRWAELAYDLARPCWGQGWMRRAVSAALDWAFQSGEMERVHAHVRVDNAPSIRLLTNLGFVQEGRLRHFRRCRGEPWDFFVYSRLRTEWRDGLSNWRDSAPPVA